MAQLNAPVSPTPVALSRDVPSGVVIGTRLHGQDLAIWRDSSGSVHVWDDRCPHRGMRLSLGFLRDGQLACPYHGWRFDPRGQCAHIPAHPHSVPSGSVAVKAFRAGEAGGLIWLGPVPDLTGGTAVRTVTVNRGLGDVRLGMAGDRWWSGQRHGVGWSELVSEERILLIGWQPVDDHVTALHLAFRSAAPPAVLVEVAARAARLRDRIEHLVAR